MESPPVTPETFDPLVVQMVEVIVTVTVSGLVPLSCSGGSNVTVPVPLQVTLPAATVMAADADTVGDGAVDADAVADADAVGDGAVDADAVADTDTVGDGAVDADAVADTVGDEADVGWKVLALPHARSTSRSTTTTTSTTRMASANALHRLRATAWLMSLVSAGDMRLPVPLVQQLPCPWPRATAGPDAAGITPVGHPSPVV